MLLVSVKNLGEYDKLPWEKFFEIRTFCKIFCSIPFFLELQCLLDDLVNFYDYQCLSMLLNLNYNGKKALWIPLWNRKRTPTWKKAFCEIPLTLFFLPNYYEWLRLIACSYICRE